MVEDKAEEKMDLVSMKGAVDRLATFIWALAYYKVPPNEIDIATKVMIEGDKKMHGSSREWAEGVARDIIYG